MSTPETEVHRDAPQAPRNQLAYEALLEAAAALPAGKFVHITVKIGDATGAVLERLPMIRALRPEIVEHCPAHGLALIDGLEERARALRYADALHQTALEPPPPTAAPAAALRKKLKYWAPELALWVARGHLPDALSELLKYTPSHRKLAQNCMSIVIHLRRCWTGLIGKTELTAAELDALEAAAEALDVLIAERDARAREASATADIRNRMFTLLDSSLAELERAVLYLHRDEKEKYLPPVYAEHGKRVREAGV